MRCSMRKNAKRVDIVTVKLVKESSILYAKRSIRSPQDGYELIREFLEDKDREYFIVVSLDTKNQPTNINVTSIGTLNSALIHPREIFKAAIVGNACSIMFGHIGMIFYRRNYSLLYLQCYIYFAIYPLAK